MDDARRRRIFSRNYTEACGDRCPGGFKPEKLSMRWSGIFGSFGSVEKTSQHRSTNVLRAATEHFAHEKGRKIDDHNCPLADNSATQATTIVDIQDVPFSAPFPLFFRMS